MNPCSIRQRKSAPVTSFRFIGSREFVCDPAALVAARRRTYRIPSPRHDPARILVGPLPVVPIVRSFFGCTRRSRGIGACFFVLSSEHGFRYTSRGGSKQRIHLDLRTIEIPFLLEAARRSEESSSDLGEANTLLSSSCF